MIWESKDGMRIEVSEAALASVAKHISSRKRGETGGILIGRYSDDLSTAKVMSASGPGPRATFGPSSFTRQAFSLQARLDREFEAGRYYLGEWHCHPGTNSAPSSQDIRQMKAISKSQTTTARSQSSWCSGKETRVSSALWSLSRMTGLSDLEGFRTWTR